MIFISFNRLFFNFARLFLPHLNRNSRHLLSRTFIAAVGSTTASIMNKPDYTINCLKDSNTACEQLCLACKQGNLLEVKKIISSGIDGNCKHNLGWSPLHVAAANKFEDIAKILIDNNADVNVLEEFPGVIKLAARRHINPTEIGYARMEQFSKHFNPNTDFTGCTPLHYAVFSDNENMIKLLLQSGADITIKNTYGEIPSDLALGTKIKEFVINEYEKAYKNKLELEKEERKKYPLNDRLKETIIGQDEAINTVTSTIRRRESGWTRGDKPLVFLFLGSSGVGKTELAKQTANYLFKDNKKCFIRVDMSEYQSRHEVSKFIGSPPGYIGYDQGGQLTSALKECPEAVVLFDEIEKAHPDIITIMLQLFDEGRLTDGQGHTVNCPKAIFIMTSNLASEEIAKYATKLRVNKPDEENVSVSKKFKDDVMYPILKRHFKRDEFLGRITEMVYFLPFTKNELSKLVEIELNFWSKQAQDKHKISITWEPDLLNVLSDGYDIHYGARSLKHEVEKKIVNKIAKLHDGGSLEKNSSVHIKVNYGENEPLETPEIIFDIQKSPWYKF